MQWPTFRAFLKIRFEKHGGFVCINRNERPRASAHALDQGDEEGHLFEVEI